jgi:ABC-type transporter Mla MlaB component
MKRSPIKKIGKIGRLNIKALRELTKVWETKSIQYCEVMILHECSWDLTNCHRHKRVWYRGKPELLWDFNQVIRVCSAAHNLLEYNRELCEEVFVNLRGEE